MTRQVNNERKEMGRRCKCMKIYRSRSDVGRSDVGRDGYVVWPLCVTRRYEDPLSVSPTTSSRVLGPLLIVPRDICRPWSSFNLKVVRGGAYQGYGKEWRLNKTGGYEDQ